jgi:transcription elongation factor Elf1
MLTLNRQREPLASTFTCLFCNHEKAIQVKLDKKAGVGNLHCKVCGQKFQTGINYLSAAVDVYSDWVDACEEVAKHAANEEAEDAKFSSYGTAGGGSGDTVLARDVGAIDDEDEDADYGD